MVNTYRKILSVLFAGVFLVGVIGCSSLTSSDDNGSDGEIAQPQELNLTQEIPDSLQQNAPEAWALATSMIAQVDLGISVASSIAQVLSVTGGEQSFTQEGVTVTYQAEPETRNDTEGTSWTILYDGQVEGDPDQSFDELAAYEGWTANDGSQGQYTWNLDAYSSVEDGGDDDNNVYEVNWSTDSEGTITVDIVNQTDDDQVEQDLTLVLNEDGSGQLSGQAAQGDNVSYQWNAEGQLI